MSDRFAQRRTFLKSMGWATSKMDPLAGDASARRYFRLARASGERAVLMDAPPSSNPSINAFVEIDQFLRSHGFSAPEIFGSDESAGFILMEDLGDALFAQVIPDVSAELLYGSAVDLLLAIAPLKAPGGLIKFDAPTLAEMISPYFEFYLPATEIPVDTDTMASIQSRLETAFGKQDVTPSVLALRDYHAENLIWLPDRMGDARVGLLDFQDAVLAHPAYDLVSLLQDARRDVEPALEAEMIARYIQASGTQAVEFARQYAVLGLQRNLRIMGVFARLATTYSKPQYLSLMPRVWGHVLRNLQHPDLGDIRAILNPVLVAPDENILRRLSDHEA